MTSLYKNFLLCFYALMPVIVVARLQNQSITIEPVPVLTLQEQLNVAGGWAARDNKTYTVQLSEEPMRFDVPLVIPAHVSLVADGDGCRSARLIYTGGPTTEPLIKVTGNSYGSVIRGIELRVGNTTLGNLTAIEFGPEVKNATLEDFRFAHYGMNCQGIVVRGQESLTVEKVDVRCSIALVIRGGDNHCFRDCDFGTSVTEAQRATMHDGTLPCTCVWVAGMPNQWLFEGSQTWQGGDYAIYGRVRSPRSGQALILRNVRWEQSLSATSLEHRAVDIRFSDRMLENLVIDTGCRFTNRLKCYYVTGVHKLGVSASTWLDGDKWYRREPSE